MKEKLHYFLQWLRKGAVQVVSSYPVEMAVALAATVVGLLAYEDVWTEAVPRLSVAPLFFFLALAVNNLVTGRWRMLYFLCWIPLVPLLFWSGTEAWIESASFRLSLGVLAPLAVLMSRRAVENERFVCDAWVWLWAGAFALFFANVALGLFCAILYSTTYIFGFGGAWVGDVAMWAVIVTELLVAPALLLMMAGGWLGEAYRGSHVADMLFNYIVTPALLIYTVILYLYMAKILATWSLPEGGVAYLVFGFTIAALVVKAVQSLLEKRMYDWFFDRFSLVSLPLLVLFWIGVVRRVGEYGLTEPRVYLLVCGGLMSLCVVLFLGRYGRYLWVCLAGFVIFAALAYIPVLGPERVSANSQYNRALRMAVALDLLDEDGSVMPERFGSDTTKIVEYHRLYESLSYVERRDSAHFACFGVDMETVREAIPSMYYQQIVFGYDYQSSDPRPIFRISTSDNRPGLGIGHYRTLYVDFPYEVVDQDTLRLNFSGQRPDTLFVAGELLARQLHRAGIDNSSLPTESTLDAVAERLLLYEDDRLMIVFSEMTIERCDSTLCLIGASVDAVLTR